MGKTIRRKDKKQKRFIKTKNRNKDKKRQSAYGDDENSKNDRDYNHY